MVHNSFLHCFLLLSTLLPTVTVSFPPHWRTYYPSEKKVEADRFHIHVLKQLALLTAAALLEGVSSVPSLFVPDHLYPASTLRRFEQ
jgi:hypothetical protein